ncbi:MAG: hypothetical protein HFI31_10045 [Lachnospiraceae bacterium]|nr:hypothetical protein [Lachnospiraceae bacterium]
MQMDGKKNFVFIGETGSGKSEIAVNLACELAKRGERKVHFFDMDMTKPLFRSRDLQEEFDRMGVGLHYERQFADAPTMVGGVPYYLKKEDSCVILDVGGDHIGARLVGGYGAYLNQEHTAVCYVLNPYRPWSDHIDHIDETLGRILGVSHIRLDKLQMISNPNNGYSTTLEEFLEGDKRMKEILKPYAEVAFSCVREELYHQAKEKTEMPLMPVHLYFKYEWLPKETEASEADFETDSRRRI